MLRPLPSEVILFARALSAQPAHARRSLARRWLKAADMGPPTGNQQMAGDRRRGEGSLALVLMQQSIPPLSYGDDPEFLSSLRIVADAVLTHTAPKR